MENYTFLSYASQDSRLAKEVLDELKSQKVVVYTSKEDARITDKEFPVGDLVLDASYYVLLLSSHSDKSERVIAELATAFASGKNMMVLLLEDCKVPKTLEKYVSNSNPFPYYLNKSKVVTALAERVKKHV